MSRIRENRYELSFGKYVGVLVDEELMKKLAKIQHETKEKILTLLENNKDKYWDYSWSIADGLESISQTERTFKYVDHEEKYITLDKRIAEIFDIKKVDNLYDVGKLGHVKTREQAELEHVEHLKMISKEEAE